MSTKENNTQSISESVKAGIATAKQQTPPGAIGGPVNDWGDGHPAIHLKTYGMDHGKLPPRSAEDIVRHLGHMFITEGIPEEERESIVEGVLIQTFTVMEDFNPAQVVEAVDAVRAAGIPVSKLLGDFAEHCRTTGEMPKWEFEVKTENGLPDPKAAETAEAADIVLERDGIVRPRNLFMGGTLLGAAGGIVWKGLNYGTISGAVIAAGTSWWAGEAVEKQLTETELTGISESMAAAGLGLAVGFGAAMIGNGVRALVSPKKDEPETIIEDDMLAISDNAETGLDMNAFASLVA